MRTGKCQCGDIRYIAEGEPHSHKLCHCRDCQATSGAPAVAWATYPRDAVRVVQGSSRRSNAGCGSTQRFFCPRCGTGLFQVDKARQSDWVEVQSCTLEEPVAPPNVQVETSEQLQWIEHLNRLPEHDRYPFET